MTNRTLDLKSKPSEFLTQALQDLQKVVRVRNVKVSMNSWCRGDGKVCKVCLAGATIIMRDDKEFTKTIKDGLDVNPTWYDVDTQIKLYAINGFRLGKISQTLREYGLATRKQILKFEESFDPRRKIPKYHTDNPLEFCIAIDKLTKDLETIGL